MATGSQVSRAPGRRVRLPDLVPPRGARPTGVFDDGTPEGKIIYEMQVLDIRAMKAEKTARRDPVTGEELWRKHPTTGEKLYPVLELPRQPIMRTKRFILQGGPSLKVTMVENFETDPAEAREAERKAKVADFTLDLANEAVRRGFANASDMMDELFGALQPPDGSALADGIKEVDAVGDLTELSEEEVATKLPPKKRRRKKG